MDENYLAHHGIKGMKWGIRRTPEELGHRTSSKRQRAKEAKRREREEEKARKKVEDHEKLKDYLRAHPKKLPKYSHELTQEEANEIIKNIEFDRKLKDIRQQEIDRGWNKIKSFNTKMATIAGVVNTATTAYNNAAIVYNLFYDLQERNGADMKGIKKLPEAKFKKDKQDRQEDKRD